MKLKYHFLSGLILACGLGLSSCNDSFLRATQKTSCLTYLSGRLRMMQTNMQQVSTSI